MFQAWVPCYAMVDDLYVCRLPKFHKHEHSTTPPSEVFQCEETVIINFERGFRCTLPENHTGPHRFIFEF